MQHMDNGGARAAMHHLIEQRATMLSVDAEHFLENFDAYFLNYRELIT